MPFSDVQYQPIAQERIQLALASGRVPHAYLFAGPSGVGREMMASRVAQLLLCESPREIRPIGESRLPLWRDACGTCIDCLLFAEGGHPDYHRIYRTLNKHHPDKLVQKRKALDISVDVVRHFVLDCVGLSPSRQRAKVFIITEAERLSSQAQNAMLKTLEEPQGHSYLILIASSADEMLPTTRSRCQVIQFNGLPPEFIAETLATRCACISTDARFLAEIAQGSVGIAMQFASKKLCNVLPGVVESIVQSCDAPLAASKVWQDLAKAIAEGLEDESSTVVEDENREEDVDEEDDEDEGPSGPETRTLREAQRILLMTLSTILRDLQRISVGHRPAAMEPDQKLMRIASSSVPRQIGRAIRAVNTAEYQFEQNANAALIFDSLAITFSEALGARAAGVER